MRMPICAAVAATLLLSPAASAQPFLEFTLTASPPPASELTVRARVVVDASDTTPTVLSSEVYAATGPAGAYGDPGTGFAEVCGTETSLLLNIGATVSGATAFVDFNFAGQTMIDPDGSLIDDPSSYAGWSIAKGNVFRTPQTFFMIWANGPGYTNGIFTLSVREVPDPSPTEPCTADLAEPFDVLNFDDVLAFLIAFGAGCP